MARFLKNKSVALGNIPGDPVFIGDKKMEKTEIHIIEYDKNEIKEYDLEAKDITTLTLNKNKNTWININGLHDIEMLRSLADVFHIHMLTQEDIVNTGQRSKIEEYDNYLYFVMKMLQIDKNNLLVQSEQLSLILGENFLITFQERTGDVFTSVRNRLRKQKGRVRKMDTDYLAYSLLDCIIDRYMVIIEHFGEDIENIENAIQDNPDKSILNKIYDYKREMNYLRKTIRPVKECVSGFSRLDSDIINEKTLPFTKDLLDSVTQSLEIIDAYRDMLSDHLNIYSTNINNRLNEIMKILTIFSAIFIPLTFIAGIYGTNFDFLPELHFKYAYPIFWAILLLIAGLMLRFFKRKNWF